MRPVQGQLELPPHRFLVCGMPRSGTTLLAELLSATPGVVIGYETHVLRLAPAALWDRPLTPEDVLSLCDRLEQSPSAPIPTSVLDAAIQRVQAGWPTPCTLVELAFWLSAPELDEAAAVGEKTPAHLMWAGRAMAADPELKVVALIRDPRDVHRSLREVPWNAGDPVENALRWRRYERESRRLLRMHPERVHLLRFEDLVRHPEEVLGQLRSFLWSDHLGAAPEASPPPAAATFDPVREPWKRGAAAAPDPAVAERWHVDPSAEDRIVGALCGRALRRHGYRPPRRATLVPLRMLPRAVRAAGRIQRIGRSPRS